MTDTRATEDGTGATGDGTRPTGDPRPSVGVVLGGGGARGLAHVGVLQSLEAAGITPSAIVGVSMGSIVGAAYASRPDWLQALSSIDTDALPGHEDLSDSEGFERLRNLVRSAVKLAPKALSFTLSGGFEEYGRATLGEILGETAFEDLRIPFAAVAANLTTGTREVFTEGDLIGAVLASSALPVLTSPVDVGGNRYLDGGFVDPAPIDVCRQLGAERVIMVNVGTPLSGEAEVDGPLTGILRAFEIGAQRFVEVRTGEADLLVAPAFPPGVSWLSFDRAEDLVRTGRDAMDAAIDDVHALLA